MSRCGQELVRQVDHYHAARAEDSRNRPQQRLTSVKSFSQLYNEIVNPGREKNRSELKREGSRVLTRSAANIPAKYSLRRSCVKSKSESKLKDHSTTMGRRSKSNHQLIRDGAWLKTNHSSTYEQPSKQPTPCLPEQRLNQLNEQLHQAVVGIDHSRHLHLQAGQCFLDFESFWDILVMLRYATAKEVRVARSLWETLGGEEYGGMMLGNMRTLLEAIQGINVPHRTPVETDKYYLSSDMKLILTTDLQSRLSNEYRCFRVLRHGCSPSKQHSKFYERPEKDFFEEVTKHAPKSGPTEGTFVTRLIREHHQLRKNQLPKIVELKKNNMKMRRKQPIEKENQPLGNIKPKQTQAATQQTSPKKQSKLTAYREPPNELFNLRPLGSEVSTKANTGRHSSKRIPLLSVDVNLGEGQKEKLIVYEGESAKIVALALAAKHNLSQQMRVRFETTLQNHIAGLLTRIDELPEETSELE